MGSAAWGYAAPAAGVASRQGRYWVTGMSSGTRPLVDGNAHPAAARTPVWVRFPSLTPTRAHQGTCAPLSSRRSVPRELGYGRSQVIEVVFLSESAPDLLLALDRHPGGHSVQWLWSHQPT